MGVPPMWFTRSGSGEVMLGALRLPRVHTQWIYACSLYKLMSDLVGLLSMWL